MLQSALGLLVMVGVGLAIGWRWHDGAGAPWAPSGCCCCCGSRCCGSASTWRMVAGRPEMVQAVQILVWPVGFLSNAFAAPESMPGWLGAVVRVEPDVGDGHGGPGAVRQPGVGRRRFLGADHAVLLALVWPLVLTAVFFPLAVRRYRALGR